ncbi:BTB/POZ protein [Xylariaceae sp. FL0255]|nr:BTB/POZ protein [Xylariaceae sp. FL0255]
MATQASQEDSSDGESVITINSSDYGNRDSSPASFDEKLLKEGLFSDVKVICGNKEWKLHKAIICCRSEYFRAAFTSAFKEAATGQMIIEEREPHQVEWLIYCIYTGKATPDLAKRLESSDSLVSAVEEVMEVADFFCYPQIEDILIPYLRSLFLYGAVRTLGYTPEEYKEVDRRSSVKVFGKFLGTFFALAETIYARRKPSDKLDKTFVEFFSLTRFQLFDGEANRARMEKIPYRSASVLKAFMEEQYMQLDVSTRPPHEEIPESCSSCYSNWSWDGVNNPEEMKIPRAFGELWYDDSGSICGHCENCTERGKTDL